MSVRIPASCATAGPIVVGTVGSLCSLCGLGFRDTPHFGFPVPHPETGTGRDVQYIMTNNSYDYYYYYVSYTNRRERLDTQWCAEEDVRHQHLQLRETLYQAFEI